jgi:hypothetical protein
LYSTRFNGRSRPYDLNENIFFLRLGVKLSLSYYCSTQHRRITKYWGENKRLNFLVYPMRRTVSPQVTVWPHMVRRTEAAAASNVRTVLKVLKLSKMFWLVYVRASPTGKCNFYFILTATYKKRKKKLLLLFFVEKTSQNLPEFSFVLKYFPNFKNFQLNSLNF